MNAVGHSLWLMPEGETYRELRGLIGRLARRLHSPDFEPHVTLLGGIAGSVADVLATAGSLARRIAPLPLRLGGAAMGGDYFHCLFLEVEAPSELIQAHALAEAAFGRLRHEPIEAHLSLAYGHIPPPRAQEIVAEIGELDLRFVAQTLRVEKTQGGVAEWQEAGRFRLSG
jgi:hypothetical protein